MLKDIRFLMGLLPDRWKQMSRKRWFPCSWNEHIFCASDCVTYINTYDNKQGRRQTPFRKCQTRRYPFLSKYDITISVISPRDVHSLPFCCNTICKRMSKCNQCNESSAQFSKGNQGLIYSNISLELIFHQSWIPATKIK